MRIPFTYIFALMAAWTAFGQEVNTQPANGPTNTIIGFGDGSQFTINATQGPPSTAYPITPTAITNSTLQLTTQNQSLATSAFYNTPVNITEFVAVFKFTSYSSNWNPADGLTFTIQNDPRGPNALGADGERLGYGGAYPVSGIQNSAAFGINLYSGRPLGTFVLQNGYAPGYYASGQFSYATFSNGNQYTVTLTYANSQLAASISGPDLLSPYESYYYNVNLPAIVGSSLAYVGFTGATGGAYSDISITDFTFATPVPEPTTWALLGSGLGLVAWAHRRRSKRITL